MRKLALIAVTLWLAISATAPINAQQRPRTTTTPAAALGTPVVFYATAAASGATGVETAITLTKALGVAATATGASFAIASGQKLYIQSITFASKGNAVATAQSSVFSLRVNTAGAVIVSSTPLVLQARTATPAVADAWDRVTITLPYGYQVTGSSTLQFGITAAATFTTNAPTWDVVIVGYVY